MVGKVLKAFVDEEHSTGDGQDAKWTFDFLVTKKVNPYDFYSSYLTIEEISTESQSSVMKEIKIR